MPGIGEELYYILLSFFMERKIENPPQFLKAA